MRLISVFIFIFVVTAAWTVIQAKHSKPAYSSPNPVANSETNRGEKTHHVSNHKSESHVHPKTTQDHKSKQEDKPKHSKKKSEQKHKHKEGDGANLTTRRPGHKPKLVQDDRKKAAAKKPENKNKHRHEGKRKTTPLPVVIHRKHPGGTNVTNNGTSGVGYIINAPLISCPEGQRRVKGQCKVVF